MNAASAILERKPKSLKSPPEADAPSAQEICDLKLSINLLLQNGKINPKIPPRAAFARRATRTWRSLAFDSLRLPFLRFCAVMSTLGQLQRKQSNAIFCDIDVCRCDLLPTCSRTT
jgi:hypothetical protein